MGMRAPSIAALAFCAAIAIPPAAGASTASRCPGRGARVLARNAQSAVYWYAHRGVEGYEEAGAVYACTRGHRAVTLGGFLQYGEGAGPCTGAAGCLPDNWRHIIALAGAMLAYATDSGEPTRYSICDCEHWGITVIDLATRRVVHRAATGPHHGHVEPHGTPEETKPDYGDLYVGVGPAEQLVVAPDGSVAWIAENRIAWLEAFRAGRQHEPPTYELRVIDRTGERLIASGPTLDPHALALHGNSLEYDTRSSTTLQ
jgi:hypothetical protein